jgi:hypothetical protein
LQRHPHRTSVGDAGAHDGGIGERKVLRFKLDETLPPEDLRDAARRENANELKEQYVFDEAFLAYRRNINALRGDTARRRTSAGRTCTSSARRS